jgi:hypothetical protein
MIPRNCLGVFQGAYDGLLQLCFCQQVNMYKHVMELKFLMELNNSPKYIKLQNSPRFLKWLECKVKDTTSNLMQWFDIFYPTKDKLAN